jgi:hypothetical protein
MRHRKLGFLHSVPDFPPFVVTLTTATHPSNRPRIFGEGDRSGIANHAA